MPKAPRLGKREEGSLPSSTVRSWVEEPWMHLQPVSFLLPPQPHSYARLNASYQLIDVGLEADDGQRGRSVVEKQTSVPITDEDWQRGHVDALLVLPGWGDFDVRWSMENFETIAEVTDGSAMRSPWSMPTHIFHTDPRVKLWADERTMATGNLVRAVGADVKLTNMLAGCEGRMPVDDSRRFYLFIARKLEVGEFSEWVLNRGAGGPSEEALALQGGSVNRLYQLVVEGFTAGSSANAQALEVDAFALHCAAQNMNLFRISVLCALEVDAFALHCAAQRADLFSAKQLKKLEASKTEIERAEREAEAEQRRAEARAIVQVLQSTHAVTRASPTILQTHVFFFAGYAIAL
ncbi:hypothetical protein T492DRAFT_1146412 [Pavlovales sp. CCMP2436]|nr:hypothetical protein T492DRAFT_1146412 [Pavlovales sp. CCMP2436]